MKKFIQNIVERVRRNALAFAVGLGLVGSSAFAEGTTPGLTEVNAAITDLQNAATAYAGVILPYIVAVGLAFIGISVVYLLFKVFRRFVGGGK